MNTAHAALHQQALEHERADRLEQAATICDQLLAEDPTFSLALLTRGSIHARRGERMTALEHYRKAAKLRPDWAAGRHFVAYLGGRGFDAPQRSEVVDLFDDYADSFDAHLVGDLDYCGHRVLPKLLGQSAKVKNANWVVLDLGCGTGLCGEALRPLASRLVGVDVSPKILEEARKRQWFDELFVADLVYALACTESESVDVLFSADTLGYLGGLDAVFEEGTRVLRSGGRLVFSVEANAKVARFQLGPSRRCAYSQSYLMELATRYGLEKEVLQTVTLRTEEGDTVPEYAAIFRKPTDS